jgi:phage shock protein E
MIEVLMGLLGFRASVDYADLVKQGAVILDVRSRAECVGGHIKGSLNIPIEQLSNNLHRLPGKDKPVILCCASGSRSAAAKLILSSKGYTAVYNGGPWTGLARKLRD